MSILNEIFDHKREELARRRLRNSERELEARVASLPRPEDFLTAIQNPVLPRPRLIAEVKRRSPSKGELVQDFDPIRLARAYATNGAAAISVLTDQPYFGGSLEHLSDIAKARIGSPLLRKDFLFDRYQLLEARLAGASAALLIVAMLPFSLLSDLIAAADELGLAALVEIHNRKEMAQALRAGATVVGINNRDLHTFEVNLETTFRLMEYRPAGIPVISESGIQTPEDIRRLAHAGVDAILVGEALVTAPNLEAKVREMAQQVEKVAK